MSSSPSGPCRPLALSVSSISADIRGARHLTTPGAAFSGSRRRILVGGDTGDEFLVLLHGPLGDLNRCAISLLQRLSERGVSASLGLAYTTTTEFVPARAELRARAEAACREAKKQGGGCAVLARHGGEHPPQTQDSATGVLETPAGFMFRPHQRLGASHASLDRSNQNA